MKTRLLVLTLAVLCLSAGPAFAGLTAPTAPVTFGISSDSPPRSLQDVLDKITVNPDAPHTDSGDATWTGIHDSTVNTLTDTIVDGWDSLWAIGGQGQTAASLIIEISAYASTNTFGLYDATDPSKKVVVFAGGATTGARTVVSILLDGSVEVGFLDTGVNFAGNQFGFYLTTPQSTYYSDTARNGDSLDHMRAYQGNGTDWIQVGNTLPGVWQTNTYALGWEDLWGGGDKDYQDFVLMIESVEPVPVPAAVLLGMLGLGAAGLRLRKRA